MEPTDMVPSSSNVTVTCEFYKDCNQRPTAKFTFASAVAEPSYLNIEISREESRVLDNAKTLLAQVPDVIGSQLMELVSTSYSPFVQAMQWILASLEHQCSTTYHGGDDNSTILTLGVGLRTDIPSHACPIRRLNEAYPELELNYGELSTTLNQPQPPLSCDQVNYLLYSSLALSCPRGDSVERSFTPYMLGLQERLMESSCGLGNTTLSAYQVAMLLTMYFNSPSFVGDKLCAAISHKDIDATLRQVVLYSDSKSWDVGIQNRQTFSANLLAQAQLPWYQFMKIALHPQKKAIAPNYGQPTSGLPYGDDQNSFLGNGAVQVIHSDEPNRDGKYGKTANDLIVYGTAGNDYFNFTSGGSVVAFGGLGRDVLSYEMPANAFEPQYAVIYEGGDRDFDYYWLNALNPEGGEFQINDPDGGTIMLPGGVIAGMPPITVSQNKVFSANIALTVEGKKATLSVKITEPTRSQFNVILYDFTSGDYGIFARNGCIARIKASAANIRAVSAERAFIIASSFNPMDVTVQNLQGIIINQFQVQNSWGSKPSSVLSPQLANGDISYIFREFVSLDGPPCYLYNYYQIFGRMYNVNGVLSASLKPSSSYPASEFCPTPANPNVDNCNIVDIQFATGLNSGHQVIVYSAYAQSNQDCVISNVAQYLKVYDASGQARSQVLSLSSLNKPSIVGIYGTELNKLTMVTRNYPEESYSIYRINISANTIQYVDIINNARVNACVTPYKNGFIMTYSEVKTFISMRAMYYSDSLTISPTSTYTTCYPYSIELTSNLAMLVSYNNLQMVTSQNQNVGPISDSACSGSIFAGDNVGIFPVNANMVRLMSTDSTGLHTIDIETTGLYSKFNVPDDFPALPATSTHNDFPPASTALSATEVFNTGRSLQSMDYAYVDDDVDGAMTSSARRLTPPGFISALWVVQRYLSAFVPNVAWFKQRNTFVPSSVAECAIQSEPTVSRHISANALSLSPIKRASDNALMIPSTFSMPGKTFELTQTLTRTATGVPIFTFHAWDGEVEVGQFSLYAHPLVCRSTDGLRHNMMDASGIFADVVINPSELTEVCAQLPEDSTAVDYASIGWSAAHGAIRGSATVVGDMLRQRGVSETTSRYTSSAIHFVGFWLMNFIRHYYTYSNEAISSVDTGSAVCKAAMSACVDVLYLLLLTTVCAGVSRGANYAAHQAEQANYPKTAKLARFVGEHADKTLYVVNMRSQGVFNTAAGIASGSALQRGVEAVGQAMLSRRSR